MIDAIVEVAVVEASDVVIPGTFSGLVGVGLRW